VNEARTEPFNVSEFLGGKTNLARALARGECDGRYEDAILILSSVVSTFAAHFWPAVSKDAPKKRRVLDSKRFIECWVTYSEPAGKKISVPLLAEALYLGGYNRFLNGLRRLRPELLNNFPEKFDGFVFWGDTADASESEIIECCPGIALTEVRRWSYPAVFYREVRSGYVHELYPTERASRYPSASGRLGAAVTYLNSIDRPFRRIHFDIEWLCTVIEAMAHTAYADWKRNGSRCALRWWIDGA
jgi:hypothetical protein